MLSRACGQSASRGARWIRRPWMSGMSAARAGVARWPMSSLAAQSAGSVLEDPVVQGMYDSVEAEIQPRHEELLTHPMYELLVDYDSLRVLMASHVFQVWDFMFLVKKMQYILQQTHKWPWIPPENNDLARFIQEIVLSEETDSFGKLEELSGVHSAAHLDMYLMAMAKLGFCTSAVNGLVADIKSESPTRPFEILLDAVDTEGAYTPSRACLEFTKWNLEICGFEPSDAAIANNLHRVAAAFLFGRENVIPPMFERVMEFIPRSKDTKLFWLYLERHVQLDGHGGDHGEDSHQIQGQKLLKLLCGRDEAKWKECLAIGQESLSRRCDVWDAVAKSIESTHSHHVPKYTHH